MRNVIAFVVALGIVVAIFWLTRSRDEPAPPPPAVTTASGSTAARSAPTTPAADKIDTTKVRRLDPEARKRLGEQIAAARERARSSTTTSGEPALDVALTIEDIDPSLQDKLREAIPILADCFATPGAHEAMARMTLLTDPALGTVIDTEAISGEDGAPLEVTVDTCLRDTIDALALPPLGSRGGRLPLQYTFKFD